jgi:hypothetical protein
MAPRRLRSFALLEELWRSGIAERYQITPRSAVPILDEILLAHAQASSA